MAQHSEKDWPLSANISCPQLIALDEDLLLLLELLDKSNVDLERLRDNVGGRERQPLCQRDVLDLVGLVNLDPDQVFSVGRVLDVMSKRLAHGEMSGKQRGGFGGWMKSEVGGVTCFGARDPLLAELARRTEMNIPSHQHISRTSNLPRIVWKHGSISSREVKRSRRCAADEDGSTRLALVKVQPLLGVGVPVQLTQTPRLERHKSGGNSLGDWEIRRVDLVERAAAAGDGHRRLGERLVHERGVTRQGATRGRADL